MTATRRAVLVVGLALAFAFAACGGNSSSGTTTSTTTTTTKAASTSSTTTTTKATTTTSTTRSLASLKSNDPRAAALDQTILSSNDLQNNVASGSAIKTFMPIQAALTDSAPVTGPVNFDGVVSIFPDAAASLYSDALKKGEAQFGANEGSATRLDNGAAGPVIDILAIKFTNADTATNYLKDATTVAIQIGGGKQTDHPEFRPDADNVLPGSVIRVPPARTDPNKLETVVTGLLYPNGVYYLVSVFAPTGVITDDVILALASAQSAKYGASTDLVTQIGPAGSSSGTSTTSSTSGSTRTSPHTTDTTDTTESSDSSTTTTDSGGSGSTSTTSGGSGSSTSSTSSGSGSSTTTSAQSTTTTTT
jgi:hypothetical protein